MTDIEELVGRFSLVDRFPQYLMTFMLVCGSIGEEYGNVYWSSGRCLI